MTEDSSIPPEDQPHNPPHWTIEENAKETETEKVEESETKPHSTLDDL